jgi:hypothetical protein
MELAQQGPDGGVAFRRTRPRLKARESRSEGCFGAAISSRASQKAPSQFVYPARSPTYPGRSPNRCPRISPTTTPPAGSPPLSPSSTPQIFENQALHVLTHVLGGGWTDISANYPGLTGLSTGPIPAQFRERHDQSSRSVMVSSTAGQTATASTASVRKADSTGTDIFSLYPYVLPPEEQDHPRDDSTLSHFSNPATLARTNLNNKTLPRNWMQSLPFVAEQPVRPENITNEHFNVPSCLGFHFFHASSQKHVVSNKPVKLIITASRGHCVFQYSVACKISAAKLKRRTNFFCQLHCVWFGTKDFTDIYSSLDTTAGRDVISLVAAGPALQDSVGFLTYGACSPVSRSANISVFSVPATQSATANIHAPHTA